MVTTLINAGDAFRATFITLHEISFGSSDRKMLVLMKKRTVIERCNSWLYSPSKGGKRRKEVSVSHAFDFVFVYLRPNFYEGGYILCSEYTGAGTRVPASDKTPAGLL